MENCQARLVALVEACDLKYKKGLKLIGLICVLETLLLPSQIGFMTFEHAYELYSGYQEGLPDKEHFRDKLLNDQHGLHVLIFTNPSDGQRFVLLSGNGLDIAKFLHYVENSHVSAEQDDSCKRFDLCRVYQQGIKINGHRI